MAHRGEKFCLLFPKAEMTWSAPFSSVPWCTLTEKRSLPLRQESAEGAFVHLVWQGVPRGVAIEL